MACWENPSHQEVLLGTKAGITFSLAGDPPWEDAPQVCLFSSLGLSRGSQDSAPTVFSLNSQEDDGYEYE